MCIKWLTLALAAHAAVIIGTKCGCLGTGFAFVIKDGLAIINGVFR